MILDQSAPIHGEYDKVKSFITIHSPEVITLIGHTDQLGSNAYNITLSKQRATNIKTWIEKNYPQIKVATEWKSFHQLAQNQNNQKSRAKNRRVVVQIPQ